MAAVFSEMFLEFLRRNVMVAVVILAVLLARLLLKKLPKKYAYALWSVVALRMIFNFDIPSFFSIFNVFVHAGNGGVLPESDRMMSDQAGLGNTAGAGQVVWNAPDAVVDAVANAASGTLTSLTMFQKVMIAVGILWIIGIFALLMCGVVSYIRCKRRTRFAVKRMGNIWECDDLPSPFVLGFWNPQIYVPFHMSLDEYEYIVAHESYHIKRKDTVIKPLASILLAVYWINPLVWLAYVCMVRDMEMSCDEAVLSIFGSEIKQAYSRSLLSFATGKRNVSFVPLAFGESDASKRIKNVLRYKKPHLVSAVVAVLALAVISLVCLTNASETSKQEESTGLDEKTAAVNHEKETASDGDNPSDTGTNLDEENRSDDSHQPMITVTPFENILGYNGRVVKKAYVSGTEYYFYDEKDTLLFMTFGEDYFVRDLNGDGENELISNRLWSDGGRATCVFVKKDNEIYIGCLDDLLDEPYDNLAFYSEYSYYLPEENVVEICYWTEADQEYKSKKYKIDLDKLTYNKASEEIELLGFDQEIVQALEKTDIDNAPVTHSDTASEENDDFYKISTDFSKTDVEDFASLVKSQIINKDWRGLADHVVYPMTVGNRTYANRDEFVNAGWDSVLGTDFYAAIKAEDCVDMFCSSLGIRLGETGQVWIAGVWDDDLGHTDLKVIKINN